MTDPQRLTGSFSLHAVEAAEPLAIEVLKEHVKRDLKEGVAREGRRITSPIKEVWTLVRRGDDGEIVREPWEPGQPTSTARWVVYSTSVMTERRADEFPVRYPDMRGLGPDIPVLHDVLDVDAILGHCCMLPVHHGETIGRMDVNGRCICPCHVEFP